MKKRWIAIFALICALLLMPVLVAAQGHGQGKAKSKGKSDQDMSQDKDKGHEKDADKEKDKGKSKAKGHDADDDRWEHRDGFESRTFGSNEGNPPGWSKGKKVGWKNCGVPPGQAKKTGECRTYTHQGRRYYYYREDDGRMIVRRPEIRVQK